MSVVFDTDFWVNKFEELDYPTMVVELDIETLRSQGVLPRDISPVRVLKLTDQDFVEVALIELNRDLGQLTRGRCTSVARRWKDHRLIKPFLVFSDGVESYAVIVPGKGIGGEAKILKLSDTLYRTDREVLNSTRYPGSPEELSKCYDIRFFPYEKVRDEFFEGYRDLYQKIEKSVRKKLKNESSAYAQRFLGRLMFLYFLQRKGWLVEDSHYINNFPITV